MPLVPGYCGICGDPSLFEREEGDDEPVDGYCTECVIRAIKNEKHRVQAAKANKDLN